jgi:hypothetical protein
MSRLIALGWMRVAEGSRIVHVTAQGRRGLGDWLEVDL